MKTTASNIVVGRGWAHGLDTPPADEWREQARCSLKTAHLFEVIPSRGHHLQKLTSENRAALALCRNCPVTAICLDDALTHPNADARIAGGQVVQRGQIRRTASDKPKEPKPPREGRYPRGPSPATARLHNAIVGLYAAGVRPHDVIADRLGITVRTVQRHITMARRST